MQQDTSRPATGYPAPPFHHPNGGQPPPPPAAYPYAAPHPQYYHPPPPPPRRPYASRSFFRAFFATMICLAVIFGVILVITWLVLRPSLPHFTLTTLSLTNLNSTSPPSNSQSLSATWHLSFLVRNGNRKMTVTYNALRSSIFYHSNYLAESQLAPFKQDTKSEATLNATLSAANAYVEPRALTDLNADRARGSVPFDVQVLASASFRSGSWRFRTRVLKVLCRKVSVGISSNSSSGQLVGGPRECQVWT